MRSTMLSDELIRTHGHYVQAINYPTVPKGQEKLRLTPTPYHTKEMMDQFVEDLVSAWTAVGLPLEANSCGPVSVCYNSLIELQRLTRFCSVLQGLQENNRRDQSGLASRRCAKLSPTQLPAHCSGRVELKTHRNDANSRSRTRRTWRSVVEASRTSS